MKFFNALFLSMMLCSFLNGQPVSGAPVINNEIIVQLYPGTDIHSFLKAKNYRSADHRKLLFIKTLGKRHNIHLLQFNPEKNDQNLLLKQLQSDKDVREVQLNYEINYRVTPNDLNYPEQWDMDQIAMPEAWERSTGGLTTNGDTIVIAILDSGFDIAHPDLKDNVWYNHAEIRGDSIDNDNNGYIDDYVGWNFRTDTNVHGISFHGHAVAGIAGARGNNNIGVTGVNWNIKLMLLDTKKISAVIAAYEYLTDMRRRYNESNGEQGAFVVATNASWGIKNQFCDEQPIVKELYDVMGSEGILTAAGTANMHYDVDLYGDFPATCPSDFLLTVTHSSKTDQKEQDSAYGTISIDMGVPGDDSYTIALNDGYGTFGDNSAATPHLSGAIGLMYSLLCPELAVEALINPDRIALEVKKVLLEGVDPVNDLIQYTTTGGRLNVANSGNLLLNSCNNNIGPLKIVKIYPNPAAESINIEYQSPDFKNHTFILHNALGQLIFEETITPDLFNEKVYKLPVAFLAPGLYTMSIQRAGEIVSSKFLVVR